MSESFSPEMFPRPVKTYRTATYDRILPKNATFKGTGKTVVITGGATGVGLSIAHAFAEAGTTRIIIISRSAGPQQKAKQELQERHPSTNVELFQASIDNIPRMREILHQIGTPDVLVLSAAGSHKHVPPAEIPDDEMDANWNVNVLAQYKIVMAYLAIPAPSSSGQKTVINVSSASIQFVYPGQTGYGPSKAAFTQMITHLATEYTPNKDGVRMFNFHPGALWTPMVENAGHTEDEFAFEDITVPGHFALWLAGEESTFLHGRFVWAQWDVDELLALKGRIAKDPSFLTLGLVQ